MVAWSPPMSQARARGGTWRALAAMVWEAALLRLVPMVVVSLPTLHCINVRDSWRRRLLCMCALYRPVHVAGQGVASSAVVHDGRALRRGWRAWHAFGHLRKTGREFVTERRGRDRHRRPEECWRHAPASKVLPHCALLRRRRHGALPALMAARCDGKPTRATAVG